MGACLDCAKVEALVREDGIGFPILCLDHKAPCCLVIRVMQQLEYRRGSESSQQTPGLLLQETNLFSNFFPGFIPEHFQEDGCRDIRRFAGFERNQNVVKGVPVLLRDKSLPENS
jgi:hypothetical protein